MTQFIIALTILKTEIFSLNDSYFTQEIINELINTYLVESGKISIRLNNQFESEIKSILSSKSNESAVVAMNNSISNSNNNDATDEFELRTLRENGNLTKDDWVKISEILSRKEACNEPYLISILENLRVNEEAYQKTINEKTNKRGTISNNIQNPNPCDYNSFKLIYEMLMKALLIQVEKGNDKINLHFSTAENLENYYDRHFKKKAYCLINTHEDLGSLLDTVEYVRDKKLKKLKLPSIEIDGKNAKIFTSKVDHISTVNNVNYGYTVLVEDTYAEFFVSLKILESFLRVIFTKYDPEIDCKTIHLRLEELTRTLVSHFRTNMKIPEKIDFFEYDYYFEEDQDDNDGNSMNN
jgi:hypothetical protein